MSEIKVFRFRAFICYSHRDKSWAQWLHRALESFRIDRELVGRITQVGPIPATLRPIFIDRADFPAGHSLSAQTLTALEASQFIIVICSPDAAHSKYVDEEIRSFRQLGRSENIIPVIVRGEPGNPGQECFPSALRSKIGPSGVPSSEPDEPIAADARQQGDGKALAKQKVIAGLIGISLDEIIRRSERAQKRRNRLLATAASTFLLLASIAVASALYAWHELRANESFLNRTLSAATEIVNTAVNGAEQYGVPRAATLKLLTSAEALFKVISEAERPTPELQYQKATMLIAFARNYYYLGDANLRLTRASEARDLLTSLVSIEPANLTYQHQTLVALNEVGDAHVELGELDEALEAYRSALDVEKRLTTLYPGSREWQSDLAQDFDRIADALIVQQGYVPEALSALYSSLSIRQELMKADPTNIDGQKGLSVAYNKIARSLLAQGRYAEALTFFKDSLIMRQRLSEVDPKNTEWIRDISISYGEIGDALLAQGQLNEALDTLRLSIGTLEPLLLVDSSNAAWQRDLSVEYSKVGDTLVALANPAEALLAFKKSLSIAVRLSRNDPSNVRWQSGLHPVPKTPS